MRSIYSYAITHLKRKKFYTLTVIIITTIVIASLYTSTFYFDSVKRGLRLGVESLGADIIAVPYEASIDLGFVMGMPSNFYMNYSVFEEIRNLPGVEKATPQLYFATIPKSIRACCSYENIKVIAYDPETDFMIDPLVIPLEATVGEMGPAFYTGSGLPELALTGYRFNLYGTPYVVKGRLKTTGIGYIDSAIFIPMSLARDIIRGEIGTFEIFEEEVAKRRFRVDDISAILIKTKPGMIDEVKREIDRIPEVKAVKMPTVAMYLMGILRNTEAGVWPLLLMVLGIGALAIMLVFLFSNIERRREIGIIKAIGALNQDVFKMTIFEAVFLSFIGGLIGIELGIFFSWVVELIVPRMQAVLPVLYPSLLEVMFLIGECIVVSIAIGLISSLYPAYRFMRMTPDEAIREV
ncbi:MAG: ABC transporter permease [Candidatus Geothermarchaeales archaeon]